MACKPFYTAIECLLLAQHAIFSPLFQIKIDTGNNHIQNVNLGRYIVLCIWLEIMFYSSINLNFGPYIQG